MTSADRFRELCRAAGISDDKPLHAVLTIIHDTAQSAKETAAGARGLTPEGERELVRRVAEQAGYAVEAAIERRLWLERLSLGLRSVALSALLMAAGYGLATWQAAPKPVPLPPAAVRAR